MSITHAIYRIDTGQIVSHFTGSQSALEQNIPAGHASVEGRFDPHSRRIDHETKEVIDWQPPSPSGDHEWKPSARRWVLKEDAAQARDLRFMALERIEKLERAQHRAMREAALGKKEGSDRLQAIDQEISQLRAVLG